MYRLTQYSPRTALFRGPARQPWAGLETEIDRLFDAALADFATPATPRFPIDLYEDKDNYYVRAELPGVSRDSINVEMVEGYLTLGATRQVEGEPFRLARSIAIPDSVQADKVGAALDLGVLTVTLPKQEQVKPRKIAISVN